MDENDWTGMKVWLAQGLATLCELSNNDGAIVDVAVLASNMLKERRRKDDH